MQEQLLSISLSSSPCTEPLANSVCSEFPNSGHSTFNSIFGWFILNSSWYYIKYHEARTYTKPVCELLYKVYFSVYVFYKPECLTTSFPLPSPPLPSTPLYLPLHLPSSPLPHLSRPLKARLDTKMVAALDSTVQPRGATGRSLCLWINGMSLQIIPTLVLVLFRAYTLVHWHKLVVGYMFRTI